MTDKSIKSALESLLFVWGEPLEAKTAAELFNVPLQDMLRLFRELAEEYEERGSGLRVRELDKSFQLCTASENDDYIRKLCTPVKEKRLSQAALEVLAVIAYKQPVTKAEIEKIRGVSSDHAVNRLVEAGLIEECGRLDQPGRPMLFATTREFLRRFGLVNTEQLPDIRSEQVEMFKLEAEEEIGYKPEAAEAAMNPQGIAQAEAAAEEPVLGAEAQPDEEAQDQPAQDE